MLNKNKLKRDKKGKRGRKNEKVLSILSTNSVGLKNKLLSFKSEMKEMDASIFTIQETHFKKKGLVKIKEF